MTNNQGVLPACRDEELWALCSAMCDGTIGEQGLACLESLLAADAANRLFCASYLRMNGQLMRVFRPITLGRKMDDPPSYPPSPTPTFFATTLHNTAGYFSEGMPLAYLVATFVTALGLLIGSLIPASHPEQVARSSVPSVVAEPKAGSVGRITGMLDCKWNGGSRVSLGQKCQLASGLMEITYDTGAKVILQGPVTYQVEANGGYLSLGKLTGKLERGGERRGERGEGDKSEIRNQKSEISNPQSLIPSPFVIHTPTATVTDLGTEFGVEVGRDGVTETHVFAGEVRIVALTNHDSASEQVRVIRAGQFARVGQNGGLSVGSRSSEETAIRFPRIMPAPQRQARADAYAELVLSMKPAVYYRMEQWPKANKKNRYVLVDSAPGDHHGEACLDEAFGPKCPGRFGGALDLHGLGISEHVIVDDYPKTTSGQLSVSVWARAVSYGMDAGPLIVGPFIVANWWNCGQPNREVGYCLFLSGYRKLSVCVSNPTASFASIFDKADFPRAIWQHVAFVADGKTLRLYRNGVEVAVAQCRGILTELFPKRLHIGSYWGELHSKPEGEDLARTWDGQLDEIALFNHALNPEQVQQLYTGLKPSTVTP